MIRSATSTNCASRVSRQTSLSVRSPASMRRWVTRTWMRRTSTGSFDPVTGIGGTSTIDNEPEHKVMAAVSYAIGGGATLLADYQYVADSFAVARNQIDTLELADYHLLNLGVTQDVGGAYQLYGRVENVLDENYESSFGFPEAGRVFFIGLRAKLGPG